MPEFAKLNDGWNAEPNAPDPQVRIAGTEAILTLRLNGFQFPAFGDKDAGTLRFVDCARYRLGPTNDEGRFAGQCRYGATAPAWGEFYEICGDDPLRDAPRDRVETGGTGSRHFLFYLRDGTFEAIAGDWRFESA